MIKFTADTTAVRKSLEQLKETSQKVSDSIAKPEVPKAVELPKVAESSKKGITASISDAIGNVKAGKFGDALGAAAKVAIPVAIAAAAIKGFQKAFEFAKNMSSKFDPIGTEQVMSKMNASISRMQSAIGSLLMPVFKAMADVVGGIADNVTGIIEGIQTAAAWMNGLIGGTADYLKEAAEDVTEASEEASAGLMAFDKLNTLGDVDVAGLTEAERLRQIQAEAYENGQKASKQLAEVFTNIIPNALAGVGAEFGKVVGNISVAIGDIGAEVWNALAGAWGGFTGAVGEIWNTISAEFGKFTDAVGNALAGAWDSFTGWVGNIWGKISEGIGKVSTSIGDKLRDAWTSFTGWVGNIWTEIRTSIEGLAKNIGDGIATAIRDALNAVGLGWLVDVVANPGETFSRIGQSVADSVGNGKGGDIFSDGGLLGGLNPLNWGNMLGGGQQTNSVTTNVTLEVDGRVLARATYDDFAAEGVRRGTGF